MVFEAGVHGINLSKEVKEGTAKTKDKVPTFKSPDEYEHLSEEEKMELTKKMLSQHKFKFA